MMMQMILLSLFIAMYLYETFVTMNERPIGVKCIYDKDHKLIGGKRLVVDIDALSLLFVGVQILLCWNILYGIWSFVFMDDLLHQCQIR